MKTAFLGAVLAALTVLFALSPAQARRAHKLNLAPIPVSGAMIDDRYPHLRLPEAYGTARAWKRSSLEPSSLERLSLDPSSLGGGIVAAFSGPRRFIAGRLSCAINVNAALAERGISGTGSALAKSFLRWGRASAPVPGAVAVFARGNPRATSGHVAIVAAVDGGSVLLWNPTPHGWRLMPARRRAIAYRLPS